MTAERQLGEKRAPASARIGDRPYWILLVSVVVRAVHQVGGAVFLASFLVGRQGGLPAFYLWLAMLSGVALAATEVLRHRQWYREVAGVSTAVKLLLIGAAYHRYLPETPAILAAFLLAAVAAHVPREIRHRLLY
ncbi:MAG: hypothetical protein IH612_09270, partial [Desulfofustis sp.]|nr:hypothetical protein [Desulfofustis sp.]